MYKGKIPPSKLVKVEDLKIDVLDYFPGIFQIKCLLRVYSTRTGKVTKLMSVQAGIENKTFAGYSENAYLLLLGRAIKSLQKALYRKHLRILPKKVWEESVHNLSYPIGESCINFGLGNIKGD